MTKAAWRKINDDTDLLDTPSLWVNFMQFPRQFDTEETLVSGSNAPDYAGELFMPPAAPTAPAETHHGQKGSRRYESVRRTRFDRYNRGRRHRSGRGSLHGRRGAGCYRNRFHSLPA